VVQVDEMKARVLKINPHCEVITVADFVTLENIDEMFDDDGGAFAGVSALCDCIDGATEKAALLGACVRRGCPVVTCGGAAGRRDPFECEDLVRVKEDRLLCRVRKNLRVYYGFPKGPGDGCKNGHNPRKWRISAVFSGEVVGNGGGDDTQSSLRTCDGTLGTSSFVTGTYGFVAAGKIIEMISTGKLVAPKKIRMPSLPLKRKLKNEGNAILDAFL